MARATLQAELDAATIAPFDVEEVISRAKAKLGEMRSVLENGDTPEVRAVIKAIMSTVTLNWEPIGGKHRVSSGSIEYAQSVVIHTHAVVCNCCHGWNAPACRSYRPEAACSLRAASPERLGKQCLPSDG